MPGIFEFYVWPLSSWRLQPWGRGFLARNLGGDSPRGAQEKAKETRPLFSGNADNKTFASLLCVPSGQRAQFSMRRNRAGFIKGRCALDNIMLIESDFLEHAVFEGADRAGLSWLDFAAAFPSLARAWALAVLQHTLIPEHVVDAVQQLYRDIYTSILLGGGTFRGYYITRGIKQGCPLSGVLFALADDPIFRCVHSVMTPLARPCAFADDIGIVSCDLVRAPPIVLRLLSQAAM
eukprot:9469282-Pyramimonas_sp.AAC.1